MPSQRARRRRQRAYRPDYTGRITQRTRKAMVDAALMHGDDWVRCCICGRLHTEPYEGLATDRHGDIWDVCIGECAVLSGLDEYEGPKDD